MSDNRRSFRVFRVAVPSRHGAAESLNEDDTRTGERLKEAMGKLERCHVGDKALRVDHMFGCVGDTTFLVHTKDRLKTKFVESVVKESLGGDFKTEPVDVPSSANAERFVPGSGGLSEQRQFKATTEVEAERVFGDLEGMAVLVGYGDLKHKTFSYRIESGRLVPAKEPPGSTGAPARQDRSFPQRQSPPIAAGAAATTATATITPVAGGGGGGEAAGETRAASPEPQHYSRVSYEYREDVNGQ